ncbi:hypothetical protein [Tepidiforma sp.]|uniref:hypothetical protein n=1 Tax=Tepidiforma sp. TaxID=2682230 RepID=UPI002ADD9176|nr:hypothetical protein [Tepidiforma sp.]
MTSARHALVAVAALGALALGATACSDDDDNAPTLNVRLVDFAIEANPNTVPAGNVRVKAKNDGSTEHEVVFVRTDLPEDGLPVVDNKVDEGKVEVVGEVEKFPAGKSKTATLELPPGRYVLICNIATHYGLGMHRVLLVQ